MRRMLFSKTGKAIWMSHLDTMRVMQRAFRRAGVLLHHSQGYTPRAYVSMILPLSVGVESCCEIMEYELDSDIEITPDEMNRVLPEGVRILSVYESSKKAKELVYLKAELTLEYDGQLPDMKKIADLLEQPGLMVEKKTKRGLADIDIRPMLMKYELIPGEHSLRIPCTVCAQNPSLNPMLIAAAIERYLPDCRPDFVKCRRIEVLDRTGEVFR